jgi:hypothetical protein
MASSLVPISLPCNVFLVRSSFASQFVSNDEMNDTLHCQQPVDIVCIVVNDQPNEES